MKTTDKDHRIMIATSVALGGIIGEPDDVERLQKIILENSEHPLQTAVEVAVAFIRYAQDLKTNE